MCRENISNGAVLGCDLASSHKFLHRVDGSFTRARKRANSSDPRSPLLNHAQFCLRGPIMPVGTARFCCDVAVPTAINIAFAPTLNDRSTAPTRGSTPTYFSMVQPTTSGTTEMLSRLMRAKISPPSIRFITVKTGKGNHTALVRPAGGARPRHGTTINIDGQFRRFIATLGVAGATTHRHGRSSPCMSMLRATEKPTCFRMLDASRLGIEHVRALRQRADPHFTASGVRMRRPSRLLCSTGTAQFLIQPRRLAIAYLPFAAFARKHRATPGITTFGRYKRTVPILALRVMCIYSTVPLHGDKDVQTGTIGADTRYLNTPLLVTHLLGRFYTQRTNIVQDTLARAVMPYLIVLSYMKRLATRTACSLSRGSTARLTTILSVPLWGKQCATPLTRPFNMDSDVVSFVSTKRRTGNAESGRYVSIPLICKQRSVNLGTLRRRTCTATLHRKLPHRPLGCIKISFPRFWVYQNQLYSSIAR